MALLSYLTEVFFYCFEGKGFVLRGYGRELDGCALFSYSPHSIDSTQRMQPPSLNVNFLSDRLSRLNFPRYLLFIHYILNTLCIIPLPFLLGAKIIHSRIRDKLEALSSCVPNGVDEQGRVLCVDHEGSVRIRTTTKSIEKIANDIVLLNQHLYTCQLIPVAVSLALVLYCGVTCEAVVLARIINAYFEPFTLNARALVPLLPPLCLAHLAGCLIAQMLIANKWKSMYAKKGKEIRYQLQGGAYAALEKIKVSDELTPQERDYHETLQLIDRASVEIIPGGTPYNMEHLGVRDSAANTTAGTIRLSSSGTSLPLNYFRMNAQRAKFPLPQPENEFGHTIQAVINERINMFCTSYGNGVPGNSTSVYQNNMTTLGTASASGEESEGEERNMHILLVNALTLYELLFLSFVPAFVADIAYNSALGAVLVGLAVGFVLLPLASDNRNNNATFGVSGATMTIGVGASNAEAGLAL